MDKELHYLYVKILKDGYHIVSYENKCNTCFIELRRPDPFISGYTGRPIQLIVSLEPREE